MKALSEFLAKFAMLIVLAALILTFCAGCVEGRSPLEVDTEEWREECVFELGESIPPDVWALCNFVVEVRT